MIGLFFLGAALAWFLISVWISSKVPTLLGFKKLYWPVSITLFAVLMIAPFLDHIIGMRQFQKLCDEQTALQIYPNAVNTKRGRETSSRAELLEGKVIPIRRRLSAITDMDTGEEIARYRWFATHGGRVGKLIMLGGEYTCSISGPRHLQQQKYSALAAQVNLTYGEAK